MANCPYCNTVGCYNSGFKVECVNSRCQFFTQKQYDIHHAEKIQNIKAAYTPPPGGASLGYKPELKVMLKKQDVSMHPPHGITFTATQKKRDPNLDRGKDGFPVSIASQMDKDFIDTIDRIVKKYIPKDQETG